MKFQLNGVLDEVQLLKFQSLIGIKWNFNQIDINLIINQLEIMFQSLIGIKWNFNAIGQGLYRLSYSLCFNP